MRKDDAKGSAVALSAGLVYVLLCIGDRGEKRGTAGQPMKRDGRTSKSPPSRERPGFPPEGASWRKVPPKARGLRGFKAAKGRTTAERKHINDSHSTIKGIQFWNKEPSAPSTYQSMTTGA